ncbi:imidazole glycerol phosphate synthase subunit HisH [Lachnoclostridium sp. Marseille-P6806]|uniref:imidazole glycerol phosphate synthase subunit HisH n=1 Tax=Lachnoclostridium sp. Marseille-P6806 TaxID=2364793 RepID=UPI001030C8BD|nr:imidazole glycerol phosphate synthase subunit HisH [Lachnoclostridium sp. Marseille-P6806]
MIAVIDYDAGNTRSVLNALHALGQDAALTRDPAAIRAAERLILPGVGAFGEAMERLRSFGLDTLLCEAADSGRPLLGICLGQQLLFEESEESPGVRGLGILAGRCRRLPETGKLKIPQIGWNDLSYPEKEAGGDPAGRLLCGVPEHSYVYFVHSYHVVPEDRSVIAATVEYGITVAAAVEQGNVFACQFHPEKSAEAGRQILKNFLEIG